MLLLIFFPSDHTKHAFETFDKLKLQCSNTIRAYFVESLKYIIISLWKLHSEGQMCSAMSSGFAHIWKVVSWFWGLASLSSACNMPRMFVLSILCVYGRLESGRGLGAAACLIACGYGLLVHGWRFAEVKCSMHGDNKSTNSVSGLFATAVWYETLCAGSGTFPSDWEFLFFSFWEIL